MARYAWILKSNEGRYVRGTIPGELSQGYLFEYSPSQGYAIRFDSAERAAYVLKIRNGHAISNGIEGIPSVRVVRLKLKEKT